MPHKRTLVNDTLLAVNYRSLGEIFRDSAKTLDPTIRRDSNGFPVDLTGIPFYYLISHAVELFLKAALVKRGFTEQDIDQYGHSLNDLLERLQIKGVPVSPPTVKLINDLHSQHENHSLRYSILVHNEQKTFMPQPSLVYPMLDELHGLTLIGSHGVFE